MQLVKQHPTAPVSPVSEPLSSQSNQHAKPETALPSILNRDKQQVAQDALIAQLHDGSRSTHEIAATHNIPLPTLCRWITSPEVAELLALFAQADQARARAIASAATPTATKALADLAAAERETTRRQAASAILRAARPPTINRAKTAEINNNQTVRTLSNQRTTPLPRPHKESPLAPRLRNLLQHSEHRARLPIRRDMDQPQATLNTAPPAHQPTRASTMNMNQKLRAILADIRAAENGLKVVDAWTLAGRLLTRLPVDQAEATRAVNERDADAFEKLLDQLDAPPPPVTKPTVDFTPGQLESAMAAFKKRLKIIRLNDESKLGGRYTSGGHRSGIDAIEPPTDHHPQIWKALIVEERLVNAGQGMYALAPGEPRPKE